MLFGRFSFLLTIIFLLIFYSAEVKGASIPKKKSVSSTCVLKVGMDHWPPYQIFATDGTVKGTQIELVRKIAELVQCDLEFEKMSYPQALKALATGKIDMQLNASYTEERSKFAHFSAPYRVEFMLLYTTQENLTRCQNMSLEELIKDGFKLAVQHGVEYGEVLKKIQTDPALNKKLYYVESSVQHIQLLKKLSLDGVVDDPTVVAYRSLINATGDALQACPITISHEPLAFMLSRANIDREFVNQLNLAIEKVKQTYYYRKNWIW